MASESLGADSLLNHTTTCFLAVLYPGAQHCGHNETIVIIEGLKLRLPLTAISAFGMLSGSAFELHHR